MKLKSWLLIAAVFARGFSAVAETTEDYAAQEDLVACWDGVENAGTSGQHVDSLPDNEWRDTIGDVPLAMTAVTVEQDRLVFSGGNASGSHGNLTAENVAKTFDLCAVAGTLEVVYRSTVTTSDPMLVHGTATSGMAIGLYNSSSFICGTGNGNQNYFKIPTGSSWTTGTNTVSVTYSTKRPLALFFNEEDADLAVDNQHWGDNQAYVTIGNRSKAYNQPFVGSIYAIRVYKRQLTAAEIAHNREIDEKRFIQGEVKGNEGLRITSTLQVCNPSSPEYGNYELEDGEELTVTIAEPEAKGLRSDAVCRGWKFYRRNPAKEWVLEDEGASLAYTYRHAAGAQAKLEWQWEETAVYGTRRYVQDGLVACWDGAENSGVSGGHLDVLSEWKDTLNDIAFTLTGGLTVTADGLDFPGVTTARGELSEASATATFDTCKNGTLEIVLTPAASAVSAASSQLALCGSKNSGMAVGFYKVANNNSYYLITTYGATSSPTIPYTAGDWVEPYQTVAVRYDNARSTSPGYLSGEAKPSEANNTWNAFASPKAVLGGRFNNSATSYQSPYAGKIHAIRLYNRQLTAEEIAANRAVDEDRFVNGNLVIGYQADFRVASVLKNSFAVAGQLLAARSAVRVFCRVRKTSEAPGEYMLLDDHWTVDEPLTKEYAELETGAEYTIDFKVEDPVTATCLTRTLTATPTARYPADCSVAGTLMADGSFLYVFDQVGEGELIMPPSGGTVEYLVVGGGGAGGSAVAEAEAAGGGGGGGGLATGTETLAGGTRIQVTVGAGGVPSLVADDSARNGGDSAIAYDSVEVIGLGGGAGGNNNRESGHDGGNGGGAGNGGTAGGAATQEGGFAGIKSGSNNGGGGGGAGGSPSGTAVNNNQDGRPGGDGCAVAITGEAVYYAGGGASGSAGGATAAGIGVGGKGGGGNGGLAGRVEPMAGADGLGGGGGGAGKTGLGGRGGSGVVILHVTPNASAGEANPYAVIEAVTACKAAPAVTIVGVLYAAGGEAETADLSLVWGTSPDALTEEEELSGVSEGHFEMTIEGLEPESEIYFALQAENGEGGSYAGAVIRKATVAGPMSEPTLSVLERQGVVSYAVRVEDAGIGEGEVRLRWGTAPDRLDNEEVLGVLVPGSVFSQTGTVEVPDHQAVWFAAEAHSTAGEKSWTKTTPAVQAGVWTLEGQLLKKDGWIFVVNINEDALTLVSPVGAIGRDMWPDFSDPIVDAEGNKYRVVKIQTDSQNPAAPPFFKGPELVGFTAPDMEELSFLALAEQPKIAGPLNFPKLTMLGSRMFQGDTGLKAVKLGSSKVGKLVFGSTGSQFDGQSDLLITFRTRVEVEPATAGGAPQSFDGRTVFKSAGKPYILKMQRLEYLESWTGLSGFTAAADFTDEDRAFVAATIAASEHKVRNSRVLGIYQDKSHTAQKPQRHLVIGPSIGTCLMLK